MSSPSPLISLRSAGKRIGSDWVLRDITMALEPGARLAILGRSGAGKSTLLRLLAGLESLSAGSVDVPNPSLRRALVFQGSALWPIWTIAQQWRAVLRERGLRGTEAKKEVDRLAQLVRLPAELLKRRPQQLSGGQRQRAELGRSLAQQPDLLLLDEPFDGLDPPLTNEMLDMLSQADRAITLVVVTHAAAHLDRLVNQAAFLDQGKMIGPEPLASLSTRTEVAPWFAHASRPSLESPIVDA